MPASHTVKHPGELLAFLAASRPEVKKTTLRQWLKHGLVSVNGEPVARGNHPLRTGDRVSIFARSEVRPRGRLPTGMSVLHEDDALIVIDKPDDLLSMASDTERHKTAYSFLTGYVRGGNPRGSERVWIVHRLDRETSGLMVFATTEPAKRALQANWHQVEKRYLAVAEGSPPADEGVLRSHLDETDPYKVRSAPSSERTRLAVTHYRVLMRSESLALLELTPETGRRNQIRVQLADAGCPVVGDRKYGARTNPARRVGLHASFLRFAHPSSGETLTFESPLPSNLARLV